MQSDQDTKPQKTISEQFVLRFDRPGHRDSIKLEAVKNKRSLNKQILILIEAGEKALQAQGVQQ